MDAACLPELMRVTTAVLELAERAQAGDVSAEAELRALARLLAEGHDHDG